ncbi:MAG TPA: heptaprenyl diphosphate synthase component 1 [Bacilli bacterium]
MNGYRIEELFAKYTKHPIIQAHTDLPEYPEIRTKLLYTFLQAGAETYNECELYALVTSLVQMGLDTHDHVDVSEKQLDEKQARSRQLKVLAGDYFSSRFYDLLSREGHIEVIKHLSAAICEVNRLKMNLYLMIKKVKVTAEEYLLHNVNIKSHLYLAFSRLMNGLNREKWPDIVQGFTHCEIILHEMDRMESFKNFRYGWAYWVILQSATKDEIKWIQSEEEDQVKLKSLLLKYNLRTMLYQLLDQQVTHVFSKVDQMDSPKMIKEIYRIGLPYMRYLAAPKVL